jgi:RNA polymerase sigma-70 factor (ECF subfamily)
MKDEALVAAARTGDRRAVDQLLAKYEQPIYRFGLRMCGDEESAREVLQETMIAAFKNLPGFRGDAALSTWLFQIARSFCIKERRGVKPMTELDEQLPDREESPEVKVHARQIGEALASAIAELPNDQREALVLRDVEGMSAEEAAEIAGVEVGALKSRLHRARLALRHRLAEALQDAPDPCADLAQELAAYASSDIDQTTCARIEAHLAGCERCSGACESLKRTVSLCKRIPGDAVPAQVREAVRAAIEKTIAR